MKDRTIFIIVISVVIGLLALQQYIIRTDSKSKEEILIEQMSELISKIDSINSKKDSINFVIDSTHVKIITNEKHYKEKLNTIISQPLSSDSAFITDYIRQYLSKNYSNNIR